MLLVVLSITSKKYYCYDDLIHVQEGENFDHINEKTSRRMRLSAERKDRFSSSTFIVDESSISKNEIKQTYY